MNLRSFLVVSVLAVSCLPDAAFAFGKKRPAPPSEPADTQAYPTRIVSFGKFLSTPFMLPDGKTKVDMAVMLPEIMMTEMLQSQKKLRPRGNSTPVDADPEDRFVLKGGVTAFEASNMSGSITIGYKPGVGDIGRGTLEGIEGKVTLNVGRLDMDFRIVDTERDQVVAAGHGSALMPGVTLEVDIDFGAIDTGADFVLKGPLAPIFRSAARKAILQMANDQDTNFLMSWSASVTRVNADVKRVFFSSGARDEIKVNDLFTIYDSNDMRIGEVKVRDAQHEQSAAQFKDDTNDKLLNSVRPGDTVKIFYHKPPGRRGD